MKPITRLIPLFIGALMLMFNACDGGSGNDSQANEAQHDSADSSSEQTNSKANAEMPKEKPQNLWVYNERFDFKVRIPVEWSPSEKSDNKDGIFVETGNKEVDLRVFGQVLNDITLEMEKEDCKSIESFHFRDGKVGKKCSAEGLVKYYRDQDGERITFYIKAPREWINANQEKLESIAKSLSKGSQLES